jgi:hypothetical protein
MPRIRAPSDNGVCEFGVFGVGAGLSPWFLFRLDSILVRKTSQYCVDPIQTHERACGRQAPLLNLRQRAAKTLWVSFLLALLAAGLIRAQEQPAILQPLQPPAQEPQAAVDNPLTGALATLHGVVRNAATGEPLPRALVRIEGEAESGTLTDGEGRFELTGVPMGPQIVQLRKPGFQDRPYATEDVGFQGEGPAHNVLVAAEMPDLDFALSPTSAIRGHVDLSTGDPAQGITLTLLKQVVRNGRAVWTQNGTTKTNGEGAYRFANLPAGIYALYTLPTLESELAVSVVAPGAKVTHEGYPSVFYPEAREFSGASRIRLAAGQQAEANLLLTLEPFYTVTAKAILPNGRPLGSDSSSQEMPNSQSQSVVVQGGLVLDAAGRPLAYSGQFNAATHSLQASLPDGTYTLLADVLSGDQTTSVQGDMAGRSISNQRHLLGFAELSVDGRAVENLRIPLSPVQASSIHLRTVRTGAQTGASPSQGSQYPTTVTATNAASLPIGGDSIAVIAEPDRLELPPSPGPHWISTEVNDRSLCVDSFTAGGINLAREPLNVALGASPPPMELTLRDDCAKLTLSLPPALSEFLPGDEPFYTVYIVPDFDTTADIPPMNMHASSGPTLTVDGLTPGNYHVYVFDRPVRLEYRNPEAIAALPKPGQPVTLSAGTTANLMLEVPER